MDFTHSNGDGSSSPRSSSASPAKAHNVYKDLANSWAPNAFSDRKHELVPTFVQASLFILTLGVVSSLLVIYFWADTKIATAGAELEPKLTTTVVKEACESSEDFVDYAAAINGGRVVPEQSSNSYHGLILETLSDVNGLKLLIEDDNRKARCWAFEGKRGYATVRLGRTILLKHFALIHANLVKHDTAPKHFSLYNAENNALLGSYTFNFDLNDARSNHQLFPCKQNCDALLSVVRLQVEDNHGDPDVTCVYQLRVHGVPV